VEAVRLAETPLGRLTVGSRALAQIAERALAECYGVVGLRAGGRLRRALAFRRRPGVEIHSREQGIEVVLHIVIAYGLNLAEVAACARSSVSYELERQTGLEVNRVEVLIDDVRGKA
jgi:uncharacterized alkaline shock family protein YloU